MSGILTECRAVTRAIIGDVYSYIREPIQVTYLSTQTPVGSQSKAVNSKNIKVSPVVIDGE